MTRQPTDRLLRELVSDLAPVRRVPRLRVVAAVAVMLWAGLATLHALLGGPRLRLDSDAWGDPLYVAVFAGLALCAGGGLVRALAGAVPGRGRLALAGAHAALAGAAVLAAAALVSISSGAWPPLPLADVLPCIARAAALGFLPILVLTLFLARAYERSPLRGAAIAAIGGVSLGALAVHASCLAGDGAHVWLGHLVGPALVAVALAAPAGLWLRRRAV